MSTLTFGAAIDAYLRDQRTFGRLNSDNSTKRYKAVLRLHHEDVGDAGPAATDREDVKRTLERWRGNSQYNAHSVITSFYGWCLVEGVRKDNPAQQVRRTRRQRPDSYRLTRSEASAMMDACETTQERRIVYVGLLTGARVGELSGLQVRHLERPGWVWFSPDICKGGKGRYVPVLAELEPVVAEVLASASPVSYVVPTRNQTRNWREPHRPLPISRTMVNRIVKTVGRRAGIVADLHAHLLRHSFATHIARHAGLRAAQALMGHESVETTAKIYVEHPDLDELGASVAGFRYRPENGGE